MSSMRTVDILALCVGVCLAVQVSAAQAPATSARPVRFETQDGGLIHGDLYGAGGRGIVLAHGARFNKESWKRQAEELAKAGFRVLAIDFRGYGQSTGPGQDDPLSAPLANDVQAAVRFLRRSGAKTVAVVGGSMGGAAAADASVGAGPGEIDRVVMLGSGAGSRGAAAMKGRKLFITCRDDLGAGNVPRLRKIRADYEKAPRPKELVVLACSAHAQFIFDTAQGGRLMSEIRHFLSAP
jgi:pimeloyl-ACP methyl ester carboxylesterase